MEATKVEEVLEWIPYENFTNVEYVAEGGFGKVYKAKWINGPIRNWNIKDSKWKREEIYFTATPRTKLVEKGENPLNRIILKSLNNSQNITEDFLREIANHKLLSSETYNNRVGGIVNCYGISQNPQTKNYVMVMKYIGEGTLRQF
ncbi:MAG: hypothetical protein MRERC_3c024 [Mycoplasmataceae bacterium RC_NB112A]|nr:MAG: hypothetical protein MRERC_3c024 [Mycoplasmataceae bacterium RC_NB112A]